MFFSTATVLPLLLPVALASAAVNVVEKRQGVSCAAVHVFMARGNGEAYPGRVGAIANTVCEGMTSCDSENILFDSSQSYCAQASDAVASGISQITNYANSCPGSKIVVAGYSLGAQIVGDILGGGGGSFYNCVENSNAGIAADSSVGSHIAVVLMFGNVRHVGNQPYNVGTGSGADGQYPRSGNSLSTLNGYSNIMQDYCFSQDPICALGNDGYSHTTYMDVYANQAGAYAHQKLGMSGSTPPSSSSAAPSSTSSTQAPSSTSSTTSVAPASSTASSSSSSYAPSSSSSSSGSSSGSSGASSSTLTLSSSSSFTSSSSSTTRTSTTSSTSSSTSSHPTYSYTSVEPFVFSNTATEATTSTFVPSTFSSVASTYVPPPITTSSLSSSSAMPTTKSVPPPSSTTPARVASSTNAAANSNVGSLTLNLVTLVVLKALVF